MRLWIIYLVLGLAFGGLACWGAQHDWGFYSYLCAFFSGVGIASAGILLETGNGERRTRSFRETVRYLSRLTSRFGQ
jgi:hypothetical protein